MNDYRIDRIFAVMCMLILLACFIGLVVQNIRARCRQARSPARHRRYRHALRLHARLGRRRVVDRTISNGIHHVDDSAVGISTAWLHEMLAIEHEDEYADSMLSSSPPGAAAPSTPVSRLDPANGRSNAVDAAASLAGGR